MVRSVGLALLVLIGTSGCEVPGCGRPAPAPASGAVAESDESAPTSYDQGFGSDALGFVDWVSADGRYVVLYRFLSDTDGDGKVEARLGDHGESLGDEPVVEIHDLVDGAFDATEEVVVTGPRQRHLVIRNADTVVLFDAVTGSERDLPADPAGDRHNPCLPARQVVFGPAGERVAFPHRDGGAASLNLVSTQLTIFASDDLIWRVGAPPLDGSIILQTIAADSDGDGAIAPPVAKTSCSSRWARRFASSMGRYGWQGDDYRSIMVWPSGRRSEFVGNLVPVGQQATWSPRGGLQSAEGKPITPPRGCEVGSVPLGSEILVVQCGPHLGTWNVATSELRMLEPAAQALEPVSVPFRPDAGQAWVAIFVEEEGVRHIGRLELGSGRFDVGPRAELAGPPHPSGWLLATARDRGVAAYNLVTGESNTAIDASGTNPRQLALRSGEGWKTIDPVSGRTLSLDAAPELMSSRGCVILSAGSDGRLQRGPWRRVCPESAP